MVTFFTLNADSLIGQDKQFIESSIPKQSYATPQIILLSLSNNTLNNSSGDGDGDAALAHS